MNDSVGSQSVPGKRTLTESLPWVQPAKDEAGSDRRDVGRAPLQMKAGDPREAASGSAAEEQAEGDRDNNDGDAVAAAPRTGAVPAGEPGSEELAGEDTESDDGENAAEEETISDEELAAETGESAGVSEPGMPAAGRSPGTAQARAGSEGLQRGAALPASSGGAAMPQPLRQSMEHAFQSDFSGVQIHADSERAAALGALAYTEGDSVHMAPGQYNPGSQVGRELIGHELAHVVQQREGRVSATGQAKGLAINDAPGLESEADELGKRAANGEVVHRSAGLGLRAALGAVQMQRPVLQMARTHFGNFKAVSYGTIRNAGKAVGVQMFMKFTPGRLVNAKQIGMTQAVRSVETGVPFAINGDPTIASRMIGAGDAIPFRSSAKNTDEGFQIDQGSAERNPLYATGGTPAADTTLDTGPTPAPARRLTRAERAANRAAGLTGQTHDGWGGHGFRFKDGARWKTKSATLNDTPMLPARTKNAEQMFETTALATDGVQSGTYYGSVQWGWRTNNKGRFQRLPFKVVSQGAPSATFNKAAEIWNAGSANTGDPNLALPTIDVHILNARTTLNPGLPGRRHTRLRQGTRVEVINNAVAMPDGRTLAQIRVVDGSRTGLEGLVDPARLQDERP